MERLHFCSVLKGGPPRLCTRPPTIDDFFSPKLDEHQPPLFFSLSNMPKLLKAPQKGYVFFFLVSSFKVATEKQSLNTVQSSVPWSYSWKLLKIIVTLNSALWVNAVCLLAPHMLNWIKLCVLLCLVAETCYSSVYHLKKIVLSL